MVNSFNKVFLGAAGTSTGGPSDDQFNRVSFLSHFEGANNGVNDAFDDGSSNDHTISNTLNPTQGSFGPFARPDGEWGVALDGTASFLRATGAGDISGNFTLEAWVFMNATNGNYLHLTHNSGVINVVNIYNGSVQNFLFGTAAQPSQTTTEFNDTTWDAKVWTHLAIVRVSNTVKFYVNGVADATTVSLTGNLTDLEYIGTGRSFTSAGQVFDGKVSNVRFSSTARYTSNFTPPTAAFATDSDTDLLTCQSNRFVDNSSNGHEITPSGSAAVSAFGPFLTSAVYDPAVNGASAHFDGNADYLSSANSSDWALANGAFTIEAWVFIKPSESVKQSIIGHWTNGDRGWQARTEPSGSGYKLRWTWTTDGSSDSSYTGSIVAAFGTWNHVAWVRASNTITLYVNGVAGGTVSGVNIHAPSTPLVIGDWDSNAGDVNGNISNLRLVKGTAVYTSNFTPPTAPLTAITNTKLLLNMVDGQAIDSAAQNNLTLFGNTKTSTAQYKYGTSSLLLDGTGDYAVIYDAHTVGKGDFTIELWARRSATNNGGFFQFSASALNSSSGAGPGIGVYEGGIYLYFGKTGALQGKDLGGTLPGVGTWFHVAYVRSNGVIQVYVNGTAYGATTDSTVDYTDSVLTLGGWYSSSFLFHGNIDDFRISHMARYTSNFTVPSEPFANKGQ